MCVVTFSKKTEYGSKTKVVDFHGQPKWGYLEITEQCSHSCGWCYGGFNHNLSASMSLDDIQTVLARFTEIGIKQLTLAGGEPTEHPDFESILKMTQGRFIVNLVTHGDWKTPNLAALLKKYSVNQVQFNYQGSVLHERVHGVKGSFHRMIDAIAACKQEGVEVVCSLTIGAYNLKKVPEIFGEISALGADRIRVWEATGFGNKYRRDIETKQIFDIAASEAKSLGYSYVQSYEPLVEGDVTVKCPALSKLIIWVNVRGQNIFCGAVPSQLNNPLSEVLHDSAKTIIDNQARFVSRYNDQEKFCMARSLIG